MAININAKAENRCFELPDSIAGGRCIAFSAISPDGKTVNEDAWKVWPVDHNSAVFAVADGAGGYSNSEQAAALAIQVLGDHLASASSCENLRTPVLSAIEKTNQLLLADRSMGATTIVVAEIRDKLVRHYLVGDSSVFMVGQRGRVRLQSVPQSLVGYGVEAGLIDEHAAIAHEERHIVLNLLGADDMRIEMGTPVRMNPRDTLLLCSDGLSDNVAVSDIVNAVKAGSLPDKMNELALLARNAMESETGHPDDLTLIGFRLS